MELDDFRFWDEGQRDGMKGMLSWLGDNLILSGVNQVLVSGSEYNYTAGYVILNGEICYVAASSAPIDSSANPYLYIELDVTYDPTGLETFENNVAYDTYEVRRAKVVGYSTIQSGKVAYGSRAEVVLNDLILAYAHTFTKRQSLAQGDSSTISAGDDFIFLNVNTGNAFNVDIDDVNTEVEKFTVTVPNGTWWLVNFTGTGSQVVLKTGTGSNRIETGGVKYVFKAGESALFVRVDNAYKLVNGFRKLEPWHVLGATGEPTLQTTWTQSPAPVRFIKDEFGDVTIMGSCVSVNYTTGTNSLLFTLPVGYRPTQSLFIRTWDTTQDMYAVIQILTTGQVSYSLRDSLVAETVGCVFDGVTKFRTI